MTQSASGGVAPSLTGEALVAAVPELARAARITCLSFRQLPGAHLQFPDIEALAQKVRELSASHCGVVITQGTDTIEETAFALDCLLDIETPVIVTGAMRNPTMSGADGPANLLAAVQTAVAPAARGLGCLVVFNDEVHAARFVRKTHTASTAAFCSPNAGALGWVSEGIFNVLTVPAFRNPLAFSGTASDARVARLTIGLGDDAEIVRCVLDRHYDGVIVDATGAGHVNPSVADALEEAANHIPVVLASRTGAGPILTATYGFIGSEIDLQRRGLIRAGWLDGTKSKVLLTLLLRHGRKQLSSIAAAFELWGGGCTKEPA